MQAAHNNSNRPDIRAFIGATGSGKGVSIRAALRELKPKRLLVWDPLGEYGEFVTATVDRLEVLATMAKGAAFRVAFWPGADATNYADKFAMFCRVAFAAGDAVMLVEELSDVTTASYAPQPWRRCTVQGRHRGLKIIAGTQRPAKVDKDFLGGCTYVRCFTLRYPQDRQAMAAVLDVPVNTIAALQTHEEGKFTLINYVERDFRGGKATVGRVKLQRK